MTISDLSITRADAGIYADGGAGSRGLTVQHVDLYGNGTGIDLETSSDNASITGSTVHGSNGGSTWAAGIYIAADHPTISGNTIYGNLPDAVDTEGQYATINDNVVYDNATYGIVGGVYGNNYVISGNDVYANGDFKSGETAYGISVDAWNATVSGNLVHDNAGDGIEATGTNTTGSGGGAVLAVSNTVYGNTGTGVLVESYAEARDNVVYDNHDGITQYPAYLGFGQTGGTEGPIDGNLVFGNTDVGITAMVDGAVIGNDVYSNKIGIQGTDLSFADANSPSAPGSPFQGSILNNVVYANSSVGILIAGANSATVTNNTVYQPEGDAVRVTSTTSQAASGSPVVDVSQNVALRNDILWSQVGYDINVDDDCQEGFDSNYNLLYTTGQGQIGYWQTSFADLRDWQRDAGLDVQSITGDPKFVSAAGPDGILGIDPTTGVDGGQDDNFHLQNGSPGVATGDPSSDYSEQPAPSGGRINLGAYGNTPEATTTAGVGVFVTQSGGSTEVAVGGASDSYTISLSNQPTTNVTITLSHDHTLTLSTSTLIFTPSNWGVAQTISVKQITQPSEAGDYDANITQTIMSADSRYNGLSIPSVVVHVDNGGTVTTDPLPASISLSSLTFTFNGTSHAVTATTSPSALSGLTVSYSQGGVTIANPTQAGTYTVTATLSNPNYQATPASAR